MRRKEKEDIDSRKRRMQIARQAEFREMILRPMPDTWPARMPAYCYTALCPDAALRQAAGECRTLSDGHETYVYHLPRESAGKDYGSR